MGKREVKRLHRCIGGGGGGGDGEMMIVHAFTQQPQSTGQMTTTTSKGYFECRTETNFQVRSNHVLNF
jgi:hypothetical protein